MNAPISRISFLNAVVTTVLFVAAVGVFVVWSNVQGYEKRILHVKERYLQENRELVKNETQKVCDRIEYTRKIVHERLKNSLANKNGYDAREIDKDMQKIILEQLKNERFGHNRYGYIWVHDLSLNMLEHPINKELTGQNMGTYKTKEGKELFKEMNKLVLKDKEGYISYEWDRPDGKGVDKKTSYIKLVEEWGWVIGSGFYMSELEAMIESQKKEAWGSMQDIILKTIATLSLLAFTAIAIAKIISDRIRAVEKKQKLYFDQLEQYKTILDETAVVSKTDINGIIRYVNDRFCSVSGYKREEVVGKKHNIVRHPQTPKEVFRGMWRSIRAGQTWRGVIKNKNKTGRSYYNDTTIVALKDEDGKIAEYISSGVDLTELIENKERLFSSFQTDTLTGLGSRVKLLSNIREDQSSSLALIDISRFSEINDLKGHSFGDKLILECSKRLFEGFAFDGARLFRVHADVFAVLSFDKSDKELETLVRRFLDEEGKKPYIIDDEEILVGYNVGIAQGYGEIMARCEIALQNAKDSKESHTVVFSSDEKSLEKFQENLKWTSKINKALDGDGVVAYYQPIYNYKTKRIEKYEALMRIVDGDLVYSPFNFLDIAKKTKLYPKLTYKMIEKITEGVAKRDFEFSINLTIDDLLNQNLISYLLERANQKNILKRMVVEIVESEEMQNYDEILSVIKTLKNAGAKIAIDDFGSGYSSYEYLSKLQADYVKIDGSLIKALIDDERARGVVSSIVDFAKKYDMKTIAEFVSDEQTDKIVRGLDIDYAQGYLYGQPQPMTI